ncbi:hypothetical protein AB0K15_47285 [Amycolatopsis sp. NPDC049253]|uniref:ATP dependent DNA ligase n=1 Tax=Amycolatopsis sp. NPDC049253 TaxID=3155274 RepID=UPI003433BB2B
MGSLVLGTRDEHGQLRLVGNVGSGFTQQAVTDLATLLSVIPRSTSSFADSVPPEYARRTHWMEPKILGEVTFRAWTREGRMRHVSWRGLRGLAQ